MTRGYRGSTTLLILYARTCHQSQQMKTLLGIWVSGTLALGGAAAANENLSRETAVNTALKENPMIKAARAKWEMTKARVPQASAWEDLRLGFDATAGRFVDVPRNAFMDQTVMLEQELPVSGKNRSRARAATAEAGAVFEEFRRAELDVVSRVRASYSRLANGYAQLEVNRRNEELLNQFINISQSRYETGAATQSDVLLAQTDLAKLLETRTEIQRGISEEQSMLNVLMNRRAQAPLGQPVGLVFTPHAFSLERLQALALIRRPEIQRAQSVIEAARFGVELAHRQWLPDPMVNVKAQRYNGAGQAVSELDFGFSLPLPLVNQKKYSSGVLEAQKGLENAQHEFDARQTEALGLVRDQLKKIQTAANQYELYRDKLIPLANETVEASRAAYEAATGGFLELVTARRTLQDVESMALNRLAEYKVAIAELEAITGNPTSEQSGRDISK
jgi:outer membrane protein, heavy metal efflux system